MLVLLGADPLSDFPDRDLAVRALERVDFLVTVDTAPNPSRGSRTSCFQQAGYAERGGSTTNLEGRVTRLAAKVMPPGVSRADWVIATELSDRWVPSSVRVSRRYLGRDREARAGTRPAAPWKRWRRRKRQDGIVIPLKPSAVQLTRRPLRLDPIATPGIDSVSEQGAPLGAGAAMSPGVEPDVDVRADETTFADDEFADEEGPGELEASRTRSRPRTSQCLSAIAGPSCSLCPRRLDGLRLAPPVDESPFRLVVRRGCTTTGPSSSRQVRCPLAGSQELRLSPQEMSQLASRPVTRCGFPRLAASSWSLPSRWRRPSGVALLQFNAVPAHETGASALIDCSVRVVGSTWRR